MRIPDLICVYVSVRDLTTHIYILQIIHKSKLENYSCASISFDFLKFKKV